MKKLNLLFVMIDGGGNVPPMFGLIKEMKKRGHRIHVLSEPCLEEAVKKLDCNFIPFTEYFLKEDRKEDFFQDHAATLIKNPIFERVIFGPAETVIDQTIQTAKSLNIDRLLIDLLLFPALIAGEYLNIPKILVFHMPEYLPGPNRPPGNMGIRPGSGFMTRIRDGILAKIFTLKFNGFKPALNKIRQQLDLAPIKNTADLIHQADLRIIQTLRSFDIPIEPAPENVRYSGPVLDDPDWAQSKELGTILEKNDDKPLVVIAFSSTFQNQAGVIQNSINALKDLPVRGLVTLGMAMENHNFEVPENVSIVNSVQHSRVFPYASLVITHAGHGTVIRALANGLPLICLPNGRDQKDNAIKVEMKGCGIKLSRKSNAEKIRKAVERILDESAFKRSAEKMKEEILSQNGMEEILIEIENL
jgi:MGT family glycosyltransferase